MMHGARMCGACMWYAYVLCRNGQAFLRDRLATPVHDGRADFQELPEPAEQHLWHDRRLWRDLQQDVPLRLF